MRIMYDYQILWLQKYGGISRYFYEIIRGMRSRHSDIVQIDVPTAGTENYYFSKEIPYRRWKKKWVERIADEICTVYKILSARITGKPYDIVHISYYLPLLWDRFLGKKSRLVVTVYDMTHEKYMKEDQRLIRNKLRLMERADGIIAISQKTKDDILEIYPHLRKKAIRVIYLGNSLTVYPEFVTVPDKYILYVGNRGGYKNFGVLAEAFVKLCRTEKEICLICAGGGNFTDEEEAFWGRHNVRGRIWQITVRDTQLAYLYQHAECLVFPSRYEGFGIPITEAFYWRCPVVLSRSSCFPEIAGDAALYFDENNSADLCEELRRFIEDEKLREKLAEKGEERSKKYSWEKCVDETYMFYKDLCAGEVVKNKF